MFVAFTTPASVRAGREFARAWERGDLGAMYGLLRDDARSKTTRAGFVMAYRRDAATATLRRIGVPRVRRNGDSAELSEAAVTRIFGTIRQPLELPVDNGKIEWSPNLTF